MAPQQFLFGRQLGLALGRNLTDQDVAGNHFRADAHDAGLVEVAERVLADVRDVARDLFGSELGVAGLDFADLNVNRREHVFLHEVFAEQDRVFEVVAFPRHEGHEHVTAQGQLAAIRRGTVGDDVAGLDHVALDHDGLLADARVVVRADELLEVVFVFLAAEGIVLVLGLFIAGVADADDFAVGVLDDAGALGTHYGAGVLGGDVFEAGTDEGRLGAQERHGLALHVRAHQRAVRVVVLQEGHERGGDGHQLFGRHVHVVDLLGRGLGEVAAMAGQDGVAFEAAVFVGDGVGLGDDVVVFVVGRQHLDVLGDAAVFDLAIGRLEEPVVVDTRVGGERGHKTDVRTFRRFDRADTAVVRGVHVAHLEAGAVAVQAAGSQRAQAALVGQFGEWVNLIHEVGELAAAEEVLDDGADRLGIDEGLRRELFLVLEVHALADGPFHADEADAYLVGEQFADRADAAVAQVIDIVQHAFAAAQLDQVLQRGDHVFLGKRLGFLRDVQAELTVDLVAADGREVVAARVKEQLLEEGAGRGVGRGVAGANARVDFAQRVVGGLRAVHRQGIDDGGILGNVLLEEEL